MNPIFAGFDLSRSTTNIVQPKTPIYGSRWQLVSEMDVDPRFESYGYKHPDGFVVISAMEVADGILTNTPMPQYHLTISKKGMRRCSSADAKFILKQFDMELALEDNHVESGFVRNFWQPVSQYWVGKECDCISEEPAITEDKGDFIWRGV